MLNLTNHLTMLNSPVRRIQAGVELYEGSTLVDTYKYTDSLINFKVERVGQGKFFGYGFVHKTNIHLIDVNREKEITTANHFRINFGVNDEYENIFPNFYVSEVHRDEKTNEMSITAYDRLRLAEQHTVNELTLQDDMSLRTIALYCALTCGIHAIQVIGVDDGLFDTTYKVAEINIEGSETIRSILDAIAEATQTIYYLNNENKITFKRLDKNGNPVFYLDKSKYIELESKTSRRLKKVVSVTELGDNIHVEMAATGSTQYVRENPFWTLRGDLPDLMAPMMESVIGMTINQFECEWRGNYLLEPGDKIGLITKDNEIVDTYLLDDIIEYNGSLEEESAWEYEDNEDEKESTPSTIGDVLKQTYAKVDKVNKQVDLVVSDVSNTKKEIASIKLTQDEIKSTVEEQNTEIEGLTERVSQTITSTEMEIAIETALQDIDTSEVTTKTGFTFNADGLRVTKSDSEMETLVTEDGLTIYRGSSEALEVNNEGVKAEDLHATTYLLIGDYSRLENYGSGRTGCFWIGDAQSGGEE